MASVSVFAPAKVNLTLRVTGRRSDGYHLLDSLTVFADLGDGVTLADQPEDLPEGVRPCGRWRLDGAFAQALADDLAASGASLSVDAALGAYAEHMGADVGSLRGALVKDLPLAAGLGGGSSDMAAVLRALDALLAPRDAGSLGRLSALARIAGELGADGPACVYARPLRFQGVGEQISLLNRWPALPAILVNPAVECPTPAVFAAFARGGAPFSAALADPPETGSLETAIAYVIESGENDLTSAAVACAPAIDDVLGVCRGLDGARVARVSGSGASVFAVFASRDEAQRAARRVAALAPSWWVRACTLLGTDDTAAPGEGLC